jgi:hypothetical protein
MASSKVFLIVHVEVLYLQRTCMHMPLPKMRGRPNRRSGLGDHSNTDIWRVTKLIPHTQGLIILQNQGTLIWLQTADRHLLPYVHNHCSFRHYILRLLATPNSEGHWTLKPEIVRRIPGLRHPHSHPGISILVSCTRVCQRAQLRRGSPYKD